MKKLFLAAIVLHASLISVGCAIPPPVIIVHRYEGGVQPQPAPPGTPPATVNLKTKWVSKWDDPTLIVIQNQSLRFVRVKIDGEKEFELAPQQATDDMNFDIGEHRMRVNIQKPTPFGVMTVERIISFKVTKEGRSQTISIHE